MIVTSNPFEINTILSSEYCLGAKIGFVPTMGALHEGHGSLIARSAADNEITVVSIFVNPTQFGPNEDLDKYPRTLESDLELCKINGATHVFTPSESTMYPEGKAQYEVIMHLRGMDKVLCGAKRPGHFDGVVLVVSKLLNIVRPTNAYFGLKDFQQLSILQTLARELFFPTKIVPCEIIREDDGLAMSSRNRYLNSEERLQAVYLNKALKLITQTAKDGMKANYLIEQALLLAKKFPLIRIDYLDIRHSKTLEALDIVQKEDNPRAFVAAFCGKTRLIDNAPIF